MDKESDKFKFFGDSLEVRDAETGELVNAPGVAQKGMDIIKAAVDATGVELVIPDDISSLVKLKDTPPEEL